MRFLRDAGQTKKGVFPFADDDVYETLHRYQYGLITKEETIYLLKSTKLDGQILFHTDKSLESISFIGEQEVR